MPAPPPSPDGPAAGDEPVDGAHPHSPSRRAILTATLAGGLAATLPARAPADPLPLSTDFRVWIDGAAVPVHHAAAHLSVAALDASGEHEVVIEALTPGFFDGGIQVLPSRHAIFPRVAGDRATFRIAAPAKLVVKRPGDAGAMPRQLFLFLDAAVPQSARRYTRHYPPGVYREDIHARTGDRILIERGAVIHGSINVDGVRDVVIEGRGLVIHDGPQNPRDDEGWQSRPNWHALWTRAAEDVRVDGLTFVVRSRTWMIQLNESRRIALRDVKCIGGSDFNANQDGIDVVGSEDVSVRDCFFKASDDIVALYGNTGFYDATVSVPGRPVRRVLIESCVLCTSISNVLRVSWPKKVFDSSNVTIRDCDIVYMGSGNCVVPFAVAEFWAEAGGGGAHRGYRFERLRIEAAYSLMQLRQPSTPGAARVDDVRFRDIDIVDGPPAVASAIVGRVGGVSIERVTVGSAAIRDAADAAALLGLASGALAVAPSPLPTIDYAPGIHRPGEPIGFALAGEPLRDCRWTFGDGHHAAGDAVRHRYPDGSGSWRDGSGLYRVEARGLARDGCVRTARAYVQLDVPPRFRPRADRPAAAGQRRLTTSLAVPQAGGFVFTIVAPGGAWLWIGGRLVGEVLPGQPLACGTPGLTVEVVRRGLVLGAGPHAAVIETMSSSASVPAVYWEGPGVRLQRLPFG